MTTASERESFTELKKKKTQLFQKTFQRTYTLKETHRNTFNNIKFIYLFQGS